MTGGQGGIEGNQQPLQEGNERRKHPRFVLKDVVVRYKLHHDPRNWQKALTGNVSEGGLLLLTKEPIPEGSLLYIELDLPEHGVFFFTGNVVWKKEEGLDQDQPHGIEFIEMTDESRDRFRILLDLAEQQGNARKQSP